jgi:hypothetical protein
MKRYIGFLVSSKSYAQNKQELTILNLWSKKLQSGLLYGNNLPPSTSILDIQPHLIIHLSKKLLMIGPIQPCWTYFVERHLQVLKDWVR